MAKRIEDQREAEKMVPAFVEWLETVECMGADEEDVAVTCDGAEDFGTAAATYGNKRVQDWTGYPVTVYERLQLRKGMTRATVFVADLGAHRLVVSI